MTALAMLVGGLAWAMSTPEETTPGGRPTRAARGIKVAEDNRVVNKAYIPGVIEANKRRLRQPLDTDPLAATAYDDWQYSRRKTSLLEKPRKVWPVPQHPDEYKFNIPPDRMIPDYYEKYNHFKQLAFDTPGHDIIDYEYTGHYNPEPSTTVRQVPLSNNYRGANIPKPPRNNPKEFSRYPQYS